MSAALCIVIIAYIIYHLTGGVRTELATEPATLTTFESTVTSGITILRSETLVYSPVSGDVSYVFNDGEKVAKGSTLAEIYPAGANSEISKRIIELDRAIRLLESSNMTDAEKRTDTESTDILIRNHICDLLDMIDKGSVSGADTVSDELLIQLNKRRIITKFTPNFTKQIEALKSERSSLAASLPSSESTVTADRVGYFYSSLDGYEGILSAENISTMSYNEYLDLASRSAEDGDAANGYAIGKLVTDYMWYIACEIDLSELHNYETGKNYSIKFPYNNDTTLTTTLYRILSEAGSKTAVLIFRTGILPENFNYLRHQTVQIVKESYTGYRVPISSVRVINGKAGVYILQGSKVVFKRIDPLYEQDGYLIVAEFDDKRSDKNSWLAKNDFIITKGTDLYDGKIIG